MAGYSGTPLIEKLGFAPGRDLFVLFATRRADLAKRFKAATQAVGADGSIWVGWPKKASGVETDITEDVVREVALPTGMVDNKVCAIDEIWSGLRLVVRKENRAAWPKKA